MPQLLFRDLPCTCTDGFLEGLSVNRPTEGGFRCSRDDWYGRYEVIMESDCAAAVDGHDRLIRMVEKRIPVRAG